MSRKVSDMPWECGKGWWQMIEKIASAIEASWHTCERCGATEGIITNLEGYRLTLCPDCRKEIKPRGNTDKKDCNKEKEE